MRIDCDLHVIEPASLWTELGLDGCGWVGLRVDGREVLPAEYNKPPDPFAYTKGIAKHYRDGYTSNWDNYSTLRAMDQTDIGRALLMPTRGLLAITLTEGVEQLEVCRIYNEWILNYCKADEKRLLPACLMPQWDEIDEMPLNFDPAEFAQGFRAIVTRPNHIRSNEVYGDVFAACEDLNIPMIFHEGTTPTDPSMGTFRARNRLEAHIMSHQFEMMAVTMHLTVGGIMRNHPNLRVLLCEVDTEWFEPWVNRLDEEASGVNGYDIYVDPLKPSRYTDRIFLATHDTTRHTNAVLGSDYPHGDSKWPNLRTDSGARDNALFLLTGDSSKSLD